MKKDTIPINVYKLLQVALIILIGSAICKRSFSYMIRVKNWLSTSMVQDWISNLAIIIIEKEMSNNINYDYILKKYEHWKVKKSVY